MLVLQPRTIRLINYGALTLALCWLGLIGLTLMASDNDFAIYWQSARGVLRAGDPYHSAAGDAENRFIYPPLFAYLLQPLGLLDARLARFAWFGLSAAMLFGLIALCIRVSGSALAARHWGLVVLGTLLAPPTRVCLQLGQVGILLALLIVAGYALAWRHARVSGGLLALASLFKLYPAFLGLYYVLRGPRRAAWWAAAGVGLMLGASLLVYGPGPYASYVERLLAGSHHPYGGEFNISLYGLVSRLLVANPYGVALADWPGLARALALVGSAVVLALCWRAGAVPGDELGRLLVFGAWLCGMLVVSPLNGIYNLPLLLLPLLAVVRSLELAPDRGVRAALVLATALVCVPPQWSRWPPPLYEAVHTGWGLALLAPQLYGLLAYFGMCLALAARRTRRMRAGRGGRALPETSVTP